MGKGGGDLTVVYVLGFDVDVHEGVSGIAVGNLDGAGVGTDGGGEG